MEARVGSRCTAWFVASLLSLGTSESALSQEPPALWNFSIGAREANEFSRVNDGMPLEDRTMDAVSATLGFSTRTERDRFGLFGRVGANYHRTEDGRARINFGAGFSWNRQFSTQSFSRLTLAVDRGFRAETLSELGLLGSGADNFATSAGWLLQHQATPRTSFSTMLRYHRVIVESDEPFLGSQIVTEEPPFIDDFPPLPGPSDDGTLVVPDVEDTVVDIIATEGLSTTQTESHFANAGFGVAHSLSEYSSLGFDMTAGYRTFDSETSQAQNDREGLQAGVRVWAHRRVGRSATIGSTYQASRSFVLDPTTTVQTLMGSFGYTPVGKSISMHVSAGAGYYQGGAISHVTPVVNAAFSAGLTSTTRLGAVYRRQFSQSLGFGGTLLIDYANVSLTQSFGRRVDLTARAGGSFATDPLNEGSRYDAIQVGGRLTWRVLESLSLGTSFFDFTREQTLLDGVSKTTRNVWTVFVNYSAQWR
jgi:hypothetical protein